MSHRKIQPSGIEKPLKPGDLIVSKTDLKGRITYGNRAFADYAGYAEPEFIGKPHNMVRHPDMPRSVFKLLWDRLQNGQEVFAFVKNLCSDGRHYWVFANVTPSLDAQGQVVGYHSVRRQARPEALPLIQDLYRQMLKLENDTGGREGMEKALAWLGEKLQSMNTDYDTFVLRANA